MAAIVSPAPSGKVYQSRGRRGQTFADAGLRGSAGWMLLDALTHALEGLLPGERRALAAQLPAWDALGIVNSWQDGPTGALLDPLQAWRLRAGS